MSITSFFRPLPRYGTPCVYVCDCKHKITNMEHSKEQDMVSVIGLGGAGCNAVRHVMQHNANLQIRFNYLFCNEPDFSLEKKHLPTNANVIIVKDATKYDFSESKNIFFVIAGLAGRTGATASILADTLQKKGNTVVGVGIMPYDFEGTTEKAKHALKLLGEKTTATIVLQNQQIKELYGKIPLIPALQKANNVIAQIISHNSSKKCWSIFFRYRLRRFVAKLNNPMVTFYK